MKIAVLMSTYNGHSFLSEQLKSLYNQTLIDSMTVYIRDDGSTDDTFDIISEWKPKMNIILYTESNVGPARSFWELLKRNDIEADYYAFCDQDDIWDPDKLEVAVNKMQGGACLYACNCRIIDEYGRIEKNYRLTKEPVINIERLFITGCTQGCSVVFTDGLRKQLLDYDIKCIPMHDIIVLLYALK